MESAINASGISVEDSMEPAASDVSAQSALEDKLAIFTINENGKSGFVGASSGFSLFSPQGLRWVSEKTGSTKFQEAMMAVANSCNIDAFSEGVFDMSQDIGERQPLPPKEVAREYMAVFFNTFNAAFPLYDEEQVWERFERDYSTVDHLSEPAWYASLNVFLSFGRGMPLQNSTLDEVCGRYFHNARSVVMKLMFQKPSLLSVQALIGMVCHSTYSVISAETLFPGIHQADRRRP